MLKFLSTSSSTKYIKSSQCPQQLTDFNEVVLTAEEEKERNLKIVQQILGLSKNGKYQVIHKWNRQKHSSSDIVALDCQFVQCGRIHKLARISIVNEDGVILMDQFVKPDEVVTNYITFVSGVTEKDLRNALSWTVLRVEAEKILKNKILIGHSIQNDLKVMGMSLWHGFKTIIDISKYDGYKEEGRIKGLKRLSKEFLGRDIQNGSHSSVQDAQATMSLFLLKRQSILCQQKNSFINNLIIKKTN